MIQPTLSAVAPRVISPHTKSIIPLVDEVELLLRAGKPGRIRLDGECNVAAIEHLAAVFADQVSNGELYLDAGETLELIDGDPTVWVYASTSETPAHLESQEVEEGYFDYLMRLAPWGRDDYIEYLLSRHPQQCSSVMTRLEQANLGFAGGSTIVWRIILDRMANNESKTDIQQIILEEINLRLNDATLSDKIADQLITPTEPGKKGIFGHELQLGSQQVAASSQVASSDREPAALELLNHPSVQYIFAKSRFVARLKSAEPGELAALLRLQMPVSLIRELAIAARTDEVLKQQLRTMSDENSRLVSATAASILSTSEPNWRPRGENLLLGQGYFNEVQWADINLSAADLRKSIFSAANLSGANLDQSRLSLADFSAADLSHASITGRKPPKANVAAPAAPDNIAEPQNTEEAEKKKDKRKKKGKRLRAKERRRARQRKLRRKSNASSVWDAVPHHELNACHRTRFHAADLTHATLTNACFDRADFSEADLSGVTAHHCYFVYCNFDRAALLHANFRESAFRNLDLRELCLDRGNFRSSEFRHVNFEDLVARDASFIEATFRDCAWTGSSLTGCRFVSASLKGSRMAEIHWEYCDLRGADLRESTFHMGSSRSGLVGSPYPSHGTRTGFYTDDYNDQHFQQPETIRKANLYGSDLRGANIDGVDFYLVDLRAAKFDDSQVDQLISTGAILDDHVG